MLITVGQIVTGSNGSYESHSQAGCVSDIGSGVSCVISRRQPEPGEPGARGRKEVGRCFSTRDRAVMLRKKRN